MGISVTDETLQRSEAAHRAPPGSFALCESVASATTNVLSVRKRSDSNNKCFICAKAKRQQQSAQSERKSTTRYGDEPYFMGICKYSAVG
ncbi:hypothetical protein [Lysinibacillus sp. fls2-241-R2A-57]|uniref:hypothetical protein n=1 Tax=Lysinibacillus sp. fls2-241-R2A-57 TaxID=3040292 RepID=UPI002552C594|nr:hypothetical protein [Lysinibacillus sp. fls2-241-R2A-57]